MPFVAERFRFSWSSRLLAWTIFPYSLDDEEVEETLGAKSDQAVSGVMNRVERVFSKNGSSKYNGVMAGLKETVWATLYSFAITFGRRLGKLMAMEPSTLTPEVIMKHLAPHADHDDLPSVSRDTPVDEILSDEDDGDEDDGDEDRKRKGSDENGQGAGGDVLA